jgi:uncharacterized protein YaiL (DUF2058 family)
MNEWIGTIGGLIGFTVFLGGAFVYLRGSKDKGTITTLEANNRALTDRVEILEATEIRLTAEMKAEKLKHSAALDAMNVRVMALEREREQLLAVRPSAEAIANLQQQVAQHDADMKQLIAMKGMGG